MKDKTIRNLKVILIFLLFSIFLQCIQIKSKSLNIGIDWSFHYNRFYDTAMQIKNQDFQPYISVYGFQQSGRIINAIYGPAFAYLNGALLLALGSWYKYQLLTNILISFLSAGSLYILLRQFKIKDLYSVPLSLVYSSLYLIQAWSIKEYFNSWGSIIIPIGILVGIQIVTSGKKLNILLLTFVMSIAIQIHMLTALLLTILFAVFFIIAMFIRKDRLELFKRVVIAAIFTLSLTSNVWYPLLDINLSNNMMRPFVNRNMSNDAVSLQLVDSIMPGHRVSFLPFSIFLLYALLFFLLLFNKINTRLEKILIGLSISILILSSKIIDWDGLAKLIPQLSIIQFPWRLLTPSIVMLLLAMALAIKHNLNSGEKKWLSASIFTGLILLLGLTLHTHFELTGQARDIWQSDKVIQSMNKSVSYAKSPEELRNSFDQGKDLYEPLSLIQKSTPDYLPLKSKDLMDQDDFHSYKEYAAVAIRNPLLKKIDKSHESGLLKLTWQSDKEEEVLLPVFIYKDSKIKFNGQVYNRNDLSLNNVGAPTVKTKAGKNEVYLSYKTPKLYYFFLTFTILSWICFIAILVKKNKKRTP